MSLVKSFTEINLGEDLTAREAVCESFGRWYGAAILDCDHIKGAIVNELLLGTIRLDNKEDRQEAGSSKKVARVQTKPLQNLEDFAHTVDERFVLAFPDEVPISPLESPPAAEETLIQLDCLLSWCCLVLKQLTDQQKNAGLMEPERPNLRPRKIGYQIPQSVVSQVANSSGPEVPRPKIIGFWSSLVETPEEGIRGNVHPESLEGS
ncbi:hypothetical protein DSO57_1027164 [Entomophthora muscae]|uniref:Uncharacterized protein n=1 Tax=Entomophthora muscae TaxID=34485 RepID=A0ACC2TNW7_9FUNG|nr:hypothetical protein DSO57_1027164 [Entomophthora muscae]